MKRLLVFALLVPVLAWASIKTWSAGEVVLPADLNSNFTTVYNGTVGVASITNTNISTSAAIAHSKLATPALVPKAWAAVISGTPCVGTGTGGTVTCTIADGSQVTSVKNDGATGRYRVQLAYTPANASYGVLVTAHTAGVFCVAGSFGTTNPQIVVTCLLHDGTATDANFTLIVLDS